MADKKSGTDKNGTVIIKKYANRRLYNTATSAYVTLEDLAKMVRDGVEFVVYDAKTEDDLTRQILTQIIFEEESRGEALLPVQFLRQLIGFYGGQMQGVLPSYLEMSLDSFTRQQEQIRGQFSKAFGATPGAGLMDEAVKRNMAMFSEAMKMWPGFGAVMPKAPATSETPPPVTDPLAMMQRQMEEMRDQLDRLAKAGSGTPSNKDS
ncbi:MAG: polyhydroxyalkanoate synthesis repressor PhaR [Brevundimonas sp.]|uniref:polyhydroxyalkanoate synthesis repressor PhaR n=1 Tax=Brevundimonas sp. TaxID=1871086 RepID=UPI001A2CB070|nr:polyhydroxyalkanoate synthesis repressor PhaR [Brevundimonas sp.]MBJ7446385.1 polyhydroxyalkanoate synthesis repressor PhaR [Brevundimonas sp.]